VGDTEVVNFLHVAGARFGSRRDTAKPARALLAGSRGPSTSDRNALSEPVITDGYSRLRVTDIVQTHHVSKQ
jgi:hypothetical protein